MLIKSLPLKTLLFQLTLVLAQKSFYAQPVFKIKKQEEKRIIIQFDNNVQPSSSFIELNSINYLNFASSHKIVSLEKGKPQLPFFTTTIQLPKTGRSTIKTIYSEADTIFNINVLPSKGNLNRNQNPDSIAYEFDSVYLKNSFFPLENVKMNVPFNLGSIRGQVVTVFPYQFNPVSKQLIHFKKIIFEISFNINIKGVNEFASPEIRPIDYKVHEDLFLNNNETIINKYKAISDLGDLVIITPEAYLKSAKKIRSWKSQRGIQTTILSFKPYENSYDKIKSLISDEYQKNKNLKYVLLIGDSDSLAAFSYGKTVDGEELYSDSYYGQLIGTDYYPELFIGRIPGTFKEIEAIIAKIISYESDPNNSSEWLSSAAGIGSSEGAGYGDEGQADWQHQRDLRNNLLNYGYKKVFEFYDGSRGVQDADNNPTPSDIINTFNEGVGLISYTGHGDINTFKTSGFNASQLYQLNNFNKYPFLISVACNHGSFVDATCISENLLKASSNDKSTGVVGMAGSSVLMAWAPPMQTQDEFVHLISKIDSLNAPATTLGGLFYNAQLSMLEKYITNRGDEVMQTWILFADPSMTFRSKTPESINFDLISCENDSNEILFSSSNLNCLITITQNDTIRFKKEYLGGITKLDLSNINPETDFTITAFKTNHKPLSQTINMSSICKSASIITIKPNPSNDYINVKMNSVYKNIEINLIDLNGNVINSDKIENDFFQYKIDVSKLNSGLYFLEIKANNFNKIEKIMVQH